MVRLTQGEHERVDEHEREVAVRGARGNWERYAKIGIAIVGLQP